MAYSIMSETFGKPSLNNSVTNGPQSVMLHAHIDVSSSLNRLSSQGALSRERHAKYLNLNA